MIQMASVLWAFGFFFGILGILRGWNREVIAGAGTILGLFVIFQFDAILRGSIFLALSPSQVFILQAIVFAIIVFLAYQAQGFTDSPRRGSNRVQNGILGAIVGFINGYMIAGALWYFLDINEYPLEEFITAPGPTSPSFDALSRMPVILLSGGITGNGDLLAVAVIVLLFIVLMLL